MIDKSLFSDKMYWHRILPSYMGKISGILFPTMQLSVYHSTFMYKSVQYSYKKLMHLGGYMANDVSLDQSKNGSVYITVAICMYSQTLTNFVKFSCLKIFHLLVR